MARTSSYVGPPDVHGATLLRVDHQGSAVTVHLASEEGRAIVLRFVGVEDVVRAADAAGHRVHALVEVDAPGLSRFVFVPEDGGIPPKLELRPERFGELD